MKNSGEEHNRDKFQRPSRSGNGDGLGTPYDGTQPASQDRHSTGTPREAQTRPSNHDLEKKPRH